MNCHRRVFVGGKELVKNDRPLLDIPVRLSTVDGDVHLQDGMLVDNSLGSIFLAIKVSIDRDKNFR